MAASIDRIYMDACCFIEMAKGNFGGKVHCADELSTMKSLLVAARKGELQIFTSTITIIEARGIEKNGLIPAQEVKDYFNRLLMSGRDGVFLVDPTPFTAARARDFLWVDGINIKPMDSLHVASALDAKCKELISLDGALQKRINRSIVDNMRVIAAKETQCLPHKYATLSLFPSEETPG